MRSSDLFRNRHNDRHAPLDRRLPPLADAKLATVDEVVRWADSAS
jgi:hypothetical protein